MKTSGLTSTEEGAIQQSRLLSSIPLPALPAPHEQSCAMFFHLLFPFSPDSEAGIALLPIVVHEWTLVSLNSLMHTTVLQISNFSVFKFPFCFSCRISVSENGLQLLMRRASLPWHTVLSSSSIQIHSPGKSFWSAIIRVSAGSLLHLCTVSAHMCVAAVKLPMWLC